MKCKIDDSTIEEILSLIDKKEKSQKEIAEMYHISQGTVSRYNKIKRMEFKIRDQAKIISDLKKALAESLPITTHNTTENHEEGINISITFKDSNHPNVLAAKMYSSLSIALVILKRIGSYNISRIRKISYVKETNAHYLEDSCTKLSSGKIVKGYVILPDIFDKQYGGKKYSIDIKILD